MPRERKRDYDWHYHYFTGKLGLLVTMHDEIEQVAETIGRLRPRLARVLLVRSGTDLVPDDWGQHLDYCELLPDLSADLSRWELPAASIARNYARLFQEAAKFPEVDWWVAITGDTVLLHEYGLERAIRDAYDKGCALACCRALKQDFHAASLTLEDLEAGKGGGRRQTTDLSDFMPQLFMVSGQAVAEGAFQEIPITNRWCSEQCLGDAFVAWAGGGSGSSEDPDEFGWRALRHVYSTAVGEYQDGVVWHAKYRSGE